MGVACGNETVSTSNIIFAETKEDIRISDRIKKEGKFCKNEKMFEQIEIYMSVLKKLPLQKYAFYLLNFKKSFPEDLNIYKISCFNEDGFRDTMTKQNAITFFTEAVCERKMVKQRIEQVADEQKEKTEITKQKFLHAIGEIIDKLLGCLQMDQDDDQIMLRKIHLLYLGLLFCKSSNVQKLTLFYCLFSSKKDDLITTSNANSEPVIKTNYFLDLFIKIICIICGPSLAKARNFLNGELKDKEKAEMEEITTLRVCQRTLITFNKEIFGQKQNEILSKEQCLNKFKNDGIAWIFNSSSIRGVMYENIEKNE